MKEVQVPKRSTETPLTKKVLVSEFGSFRDRKPQKKVDLFEWFDNPGFKELVEFVRSFYDTDKDEYTKNKAIMPCITPSGVFSSRKASELVEHSKYMCLDFDAGDNPHIKDFAKLRDEIAMIVNVSYCSLSLSKNGVFCFIPILYPEQHKEHFYALCHCFASLGIVVDKQCSDVSRLRAISYDPDRYINRNAVVFETTMDKSLINPKVISNTTQKVVRKKKISSNTIRIDGVSRYNNSASNFDKVQNIVSKLVERGISIADSYADWFAVGCALASEFGEEGKGFFHDVSRMSDKYCEPASDVKYNECLVGCGNRKGYTIGTFFHLAKQHLND